MSRVIAYDIPGSGLGNKMFINALAYIIAIKTGRELITVPIKFFNSTIQNHKVVEMHKPRFTRSYGDQYVNLDDLCDHNGDIVVNSFVQRQEYYSDYRAELKQFFKEASMTGSAHDNTVLYVRNGDYKDIGAYIGLENYYRMLDKVDIDISKLTIVTPHIDSDIEIIAQKYNANILSGNIFDDFLYIKNARNIIMSQSTFSWWAAFLGDAENVYIPLSIKGMSKGWWYTVPDIDDVDLALKYDNYKYIII
jgi:hypothetical protein